MLPAEHAFVSFMRRKRYISSSYKIALIGEKSRAEAKSKLCRTIAKQIGMPLENITVFTGKDKFKIEDGKRFDLLLGCRPCDAESLILTSATKYEKYFILLPCECRRSTRKSVEYIRQYPIITEVDASGHHNSGPPWLILSNI
jgi:hypothetical protein